MIIYVAALLFPGLILLLFARITYNRFLALLLTVALIAASVYKGYTNSFLLIVLDSFSMTIGLWLSKWLKDKAIKNVNNQ